MHRLPTFRRTPVTLLLVFAIVVIHDAAWLIGGDEAVRAMGDAVAPDDFALAPWWASFVSGFVHVDWKHVLGNAAMLLGLGLWLEPRLGRWQTLALVIVSSLAADAAAVFLEFGIALGASGVGCAFAGALVSRPFWSGDDGRERYSAIWLFWVMVVVSGIADEGDLHVSHAGHLGGLVAGLCAGALRWHEDPPHVPGIVRLRQSAAIAGVLLVLVLSESLRPRWWIARHAAAAECAEEDGSFAEAGEGWNTVVRLADPDREYDAFYIQNAARYRMRRQEWRPALDLLSTVALRTRRGSTIRSAGCAPANWIRPTCTVPSMPGARRITPTATIRES